MSADNHEIGQGLAGAISQALQAVQQRGQAQTLLQQSFRDAVTSLGAERAFLARVGPNREVVEVLDSYGIANRVLHAVRLGRAARGFSASVVRRVLRAGRSLHVADSRNTPDLPRTLAFLDGQWSVICAPVCDPHTRLPLAVLYFLTESQDRPLHAWMVPHVETYASALAASWDAFRHARRAVAAMHDDLEQARSTLDESQAEIIGTSEQTRSLLDLLDRVVVPAIDAPHPDPILILGPTGSGKEVVARYLHRRSARARGRYVALNCATFKGEILESKLFGHVKGSFTGAGADSEGLFVAANGGVLFLDEVGDMPEDGQVMLLRALETRSIRPVGGRDERPVDVLLMCATNVDLEQAVREGRFRSDLYHRIHGLSVRLSPLRDRRADIKPLLAHYLAHHEQRLAKRTRGLTAEALEALQRYDWPGNVRELSRACSTLVLHAVPDGLLDMLLLARALPQVCAPALPHSSPSRSEGSPFEREYPSFDAALNDLARQYLAAVGHKFRGNRRAMARYLGMSRSALYCWLTRVELIPEAPDADRPAEAEEADDDVSE